MATHHFIIVAVQIDEYNNLVEILAHFKTSKMDIRLL